MWYSLVRSPYLWWCPSQMKLSAEWNLCWFQLQGDCSPWQTFIPDHLHFPPIEHGPCAQLDFFPVFGHIRFLGGKRTGLPVGSVHGCPNMVKVLMWSHGARAVYGECMFSSPPYSHMVQPTTLAWLLPVRVSCHSWLFSGGLVGFVRGV